MRELDRQSAAYHKWQEVEVRDARSPTGFRIAWACRYCGWMASTDAGEEPENAICPTFTANRIRRSAQLS